MHRDRERVSYIQTKMHPERDSQRARARVKQEEPERRKKLYHTVR